MGKKRTVKQNIAKSDAGERGTAGVELAERRQRLEWLLGRIMPLRIAPEESYVIHPTLESPLWRPIVSLCRDVGMYLSAALRDPLFGPRIREAILYYDTLLDRRDFRKAVDVFWRLTKREWKDAEARDGRKYEWPGEWLGQEACAKCGDAYERLSSGCVNLMGLPEFFGSARRRNRSYNPGWAIWHMDNVLDWCEYMKPPPIDGCDPAFHVLEHYLVVLPEKLAAEDAHRLAEHYATGCRHEFEQLLGTDKWGAVWVLDGTEECSLGEYFDDRESALAETSAALLRLHEALAGRVPPELRKMELPRSGVGTENAKYTESNRPEELTGTKTVCTTLGVLASRWGMSAGKFRNTVLKEGGNIAYCRVSRARWVVKESDIPDATSPKRN